MKIVTDRRSCFMPLLLYLFFHPLFVHRILSQSSLSFGHANSAFWRLLFFSTFMYPFYQISLRFALSLCSPLLHLFILNNRFWNQIRYEQTITMIWVSYNYYNFSEFRCGHFSEFCGFLLGYLRAVMIIDYVVKTTVLTQFNTVSTQLRNIYPTESWKKSRLCRSY